MPTYTYQCQRESCGHMVDKMNKISERDTHPPEFCEKCGNEEMRRPDVPQSGAGFTFKDGGHKGEYTKYGPRNNFPKGRK